MDDHRRQSRCKNCNAEVVAGYMKRKKRQLIKEMFKKNECKHLNIITESLISPHWKCTDCGCEQGKKDECDHIKKITTPLLPSDKYSERFKSLNIKFKHPKHLWYYFPKFCPECGVKL